MYRFRVVLFALCLAGCYGTLARPETTYQSQAALVRALSAQTVALVREDADGDVAAFCTGVWYGDRILTAGHCVEAVAAPDPMPIGHHVRYIVESEVTGQYSKPSAEHAGIVVAWDAGHDLALIQTGHPPSHQSIRLAMRAGDPGDVVHLVGHGGGYYWTYQQGALSRVWPELSGVFNKRGPWLQVSIPAARGASGSCMFNASGQCIGLSSMISSSPNTTLCVHVDTIRGFLSKEAL